MLILRQKIFFDYDRFTELGLGNERLPDDAKSKIPDVLKSKRDSIAAKIMNARKDLASNKISQGEFNKILKKARKEKVIAHVAAEAAYMKEHNGNSAPQKSLNRQLKEQKARDREHRENIRKIDEELAAKSAERQAKMRDLERETKEKLDKLDRKKRAIQGGILAASIAVSAGVILYKHYKNKKKNKKEKYPEK